MIYLPTLRRFLLPALISVSVIILYRGLHASKNLPLFVLHPPPLPPPGMHVPVSAVKKPLPLFNASTSHVSPPNDFFYSYEEHHSPNKSGPLLFQPALDPNLKPLFQCSKSINPHTGHIRLPNIVQNISEVSPNLSRPESRIFWNPTIFALPYWSENQYLVVSRILTDGNHQENVLCEANICFVGPESLSRPGEKKCTPEDLEHVGPSGGMRCASPPILLSVPPTPAEMCEGKFGTYVDIPGFHDPRIFWSGKGEPLMMVNTQYVDGRILNHCVPILCANSYSVVYVRSRYACFGLWIIDLRSLYSPLQNLLSSSPTRPSLGPLRSYPTLTELTRNPPSTRVSIEKNWLLFFSANGESYVQYELPSQSTKTQHPEPRGRTFAKLLGNGLTTTNLTDPWEQPCVQDLDAPKPANASTGSSGKSRKGTWHQATNSLRLILCNRADPTCHPTPAKTVFFAVIHRKFPNEFELPLRYERFFIVWSASPPFHMLGISAHPLLLFNETATGWSAAENWATEQQQQDPMAKRTDHVDESHSRRRASSSSSSNVTIEPPVALGGGGGGGEDLWAYFTYTVSMAYAWGRKPRARGTGHGDEAEDMHEGYLDDEVILGIGVDDGGQAFGRVRAGDLVACMRACPGRTEVRLDDVE